MPLEIYSKFKKEEIMQNKKIAFQNMLPKVFTKEYYIFHRKISN